MAVPSSEQWVYDRPHYATAAVATDGANASLVTLTLRNRQGRAAGPKSFDLFLSDSASGVGVTATTASGAVTDKTGGTTGQVLSAMIAKKYLKVQCLADGTYQLSITDTGKTAFKICVEIDGVVSVVATLSSASYG